MSALAIALFAASRLAIANIPSEREYDEGVYLLSARALTHGYTLFADVFSSQPPAFVESLALAMRLAGDSLQTGRIFALAFGLAALAAIGDIARRIHGPWAAPLAVVALGLGATFLDLSHVVQAEMPALALALLSIDACLVARRRGWPGAWTFAAGALFGLAALFKLFIVPLAVALGLLFLLAPGEDHEEPRWELDGRGATLLRRSARRLLTAVAGAVVVLGIPFLIYDARELWSQAVSFQIAKHEVYELDRAMNLLRAWSRLRGEPVIGVTAIVGAIVLARRGQLVLAWLACWLVATLVVLMEQTPLFWRHFVLLAPIVALAAAALARPLVPSRTPLGAFAVVGALAGMWFCESIAWSSAWFPLDPGITRVRERTSSLPKAAAWLATNTAADELVVGDDPAAIYLAGRQTVPELCDTSRARIASGFLTLEEARSKSSVARVIVVRTDGRLLKVSGYKAWLKQHYRPAATSPSLMRTFWIRGSDDAR